MRSISFLRPGLLGFLVLILCADVSYGRIPPFKDPEGAALDAALVAIVAQEKGDQFRVEETFLGDQKTGETIRVPNFRLYTVPMYGPNVERPITDRTRILLFLKAGAEAGMWEVLGSSGYCFFWVDEKEKTADLRGIARNAMDVREKWLKARAIADGAQRVEALWPFLKNHGAGVASRTSMELERVPEATGEYLSGRLFTMPSNERMSFLPDVAKFGKRLHAPLIAHLEALRHRYEEFLKKRGPGARELIDDWATLPEEIKEIWGETYYGLAGLAGFRDRDDLPFIREMALWSVKYRFKQTCDAALGAFRDMPEKENIAVIDSIWKEFTRRPYEGNGLSAFDVTRALRTHRDPETVPVLAQLLDHKDAGPEARSFLTEIVGKDLGEAPGPWIEWARAQMGNGK